jgi:hypothetical protein
MAAMASRAGGSALPIRCEDILVDLGDLGLVVGSTGVSTEVL